MFGDVPARAWLLIGIAAMAFVPAKYVYRYFVHSPSRRDITLPSEDLEWRTSSKFARNLIVLAALSGFAVFIFTPTAEQFATSPRFIPLLSAAFAGWALLSVGLGFSTGRIEPLVRGFRNTYERHSQPKRFWASMAWNAALGFLFVWVAYQANEDASVDLVADKCIYATDLKFLQQQLSACDDWIRLRPNDADSYLNRGLIFLDVGVLDKAVADFTRAHELSPKDEWPLANRGIASASKGDEANATADFDVVRSIDPSNPVMLRGEAVLRKNAGDIAGAVERLTQSMKRDPDNLWALQMRADLYWQLGEKEKSIEDDHRLVQLREAAQASRQ